MKGNKIVLSHSRAQKQVSVKILGEHKKRGNVFMLVAEQFSFDLKNHMFQVSFQNLYCWMSHKPRRCRPRFYFQLRRHLNLDILQVLLRKYQFFLKTRFGAESNAALGICIWKVWLLRRRLASELCLWFWRFGLLFFWLIFPKQSQRVSLVLRLNKCCRCTVKHKNI